MKNYFNKDPLIGLKISKKSFVNNPNSKKCALDSQGRYLSSYCSSESNYKDFNLIISGGSTSFPLASAHSGVSSTWIDHLLNREELNKYCINTYSIVFPGSIQKENFKHFNIY